MGRPEVPYKGKDPQSIFNHVQGISVGHPLLDVKEVTLPVALPDHQFGTVPVSVEFKLCTAGSLMTHCS